MSIFPTKILLATDGSEEADLAAQTVVDVADRTHSELDVVHVGEFLSTFFAHTEDEPVELQRDAQRLLDEEAAKIQARNGKIVDTHLRLGQADEQIIAVAEEIGAGLIVVGSRGLGGIRRALMGSVSDSVVRHASCPVLVVRSESKPDQSESGTESRTMNDERFGFKATDHIEAERYQVEHIRLPAGSDAPSVNTLQEAVNRGARQSWRIVGVAQDPTSQGVLVVWDTSGFISG